MESTVYELFIATHYFLKNVNSAKIPSDSNMNKNK